MNLYKIYHIGEMPYAKGNVAQSDFLSQINLGGFEHHSISLSDLQSELSEHEQKKTQNTVVLHLHSLDKATLKALKTIPYDFLLLDVPDYLDDDIESALKAFAKSKRINSVFFTYSSPNGERIIDTFSSRCQKVYINPVYSTSKIDINVNVELRAKWNIDRGANVVFASSYWLDGEVFTVLKAFNSLLRRQENSVLILNGKLNPKEERFLDQLNLAENVIYRDGSDGLEAMLFSDLAVFPSTKRFYPELLNAMSIGLPVLASDKDFHRSVINHDENGLLFIRGLSASLFTTLDNAFNKLANLNRLGLNGQETIATNYSYLALASSLSSLYQSFEPVDTN